jgi:hypothetical protein
VKWVVVVQKLLENGEIAEEQRTTLKETLGILRNLDPVYHENLRFKAEAANG